MDKGITLNSYRPFRSGERRPNADGTYSTELLRSVQLPDGTIANVPSLLMGPNGPVDLGHLNDDALGAALFNLERSGVTTFQRFPSFEEAVSAAKSRSKAGGVR